MTTIPAPKAFDATLTFKCLTCGSRTFARVQELSENDREYVDGPLVRCVECKAVYEHPTDPAPIADGGREEMPFPIDPTNDDLVDPQFEAIWSVIKSWDVSAPRYTAYSGATGTHVMAILRALRAAAPTKVEGEAAAWVIPGSDQAREGGWIDAMAWKEGEFSKPLYAHPAPRDASGGVDAFRPTHRHLKSGGLYQTLDVVTDATNASNNRKLVLYRNAQGRHFARLQDEFNDGRFQHLGAEALAAHPLPQGEHAGGEDDALIEDVAAKLLDAWDHDLHPLEHASWPEHKDDDGYRGIGHGDGGYIKLQCRDVQSRMREFATRVIRISRSTLAKRGASK